MKRFCVSASALLAMAGFAQAADFDPTGLAGQVSDTITSTVIYGPGSPLTVNRWIPWALPTASSLQNNAVATINDGEFLGAVSTFSSQGNPNVVAYVGTADESTSGGFVSNNIVIDEAPNSRSDTIGDIFPDGTLVYRANFSGTAQNNVEWVRSDVEDQGFPVSQTGTPIFQSPCTSGGTSTNCFLSIPAALPASSDPNNFFVAMANFGPTGEIPTAVNIWEYSGTPLPTNAPNVEVYDQTAAFTWANANGAGLSSSGNTRQTAPDLQNVNGTNYVIFGVGDSGFPTGSGSGGRRPRIFAVDAFEVGNDFTGAIAILPPQGYVFIDHQATGGGSEPFQNKRFDLGSDGTFVVAAETTEGTAQLRTQAVLVYTPIIAGGQITGYNAPIRIADAAPGGDSAPTDTVNDGLIGGFAFPAVSGVGINDAGKVVFTANYVNPNDPTDILTGVFMWVPGGATGTLHRISSEEDVVGTGTQIKLGLFASYDSDSFFSPGLADEVLDGHWMAVNFRQNADLTLGDVRGVLVLNVERESATSCPTDLNGDSVTDDSDLGLLLNSFGIDADGDIDGDGDTDDSDLGLLLNAFNSQCPA